MIEIFHVHDKEYENILALRDEVLRQPLGMNIRNDDLSSEELCIHFGFLNKLGVIVGCLQVKPLSAHQFQIRQMAVRQQYQRQGIGSELLRQAEKYIKLKDGDTILIEAREYAVSFYQRCGYRAEGGSYNKINIPHLRMLKQL